MVCKKEVTFTKYQEKPTGSSARPPLAVFYTIKRFKSLKMQKTKI